MDTISNQRRFQISSTYCGLGLRRLRRAWTHTAKFVSDFCSMNVYLFLFSNDILNYFGAVPNYHQIEGILKMFNKIENTKEIIINHIGTRMVKV